MKIGFDAKRAVQNNTGLGNYSRFVIEALSEYFPNNRYFLFAPKQKENSRLNILKTRSNIYFVFPSYIHKIFPSLWRIFATKKRMKKNAIEIFHGLSNELPLYVKRTGVKTVLTVHDLIFLRYPQFYNLIDRLIYRIKFQWACDNADVIIAVSECTKRDIVDFFKIPASKIKVIYQSCHPQFKQTVSKEKCRGTIIQYGLPEEFILYVGSIEQRKNLMLAVKALTQIPDNIHLVAIGKATPYQKSVEKYAVKNGLISRLHIFNQFPFENLSAVYQIAKVFVYPSFFEGFGIPVIEALWSGTPVVAAKGSCLEEAGGENSFYINPNNDSDLAYTISLILNNPGLAKMMSEEGKKYVQKFDSELIAFKIKTLYNSILD
jgi:glycosyltransferase involved in cell wall biosynthesis